MWENDINYEPEPLIQKKANPSTSLENSGFFTFRK